MKRLGYACTGSGHERRVHVVQPVHVTGDAWSFVAPRCGHPDHGPDPSLWPEMARVDLVEDGEPPTPQPEVFHNGPADGPRG